MRKIPQKKLKNNTYNQLLFHQLPFYHLHSHQLSFYHLHSHQLSFYRLLFYQWLSHHFPVLPITFSAVTVFPGPFAQLSFYHRLGFYWITVTLLPPAGRPSGTKTLFRAGSSSVICRSRVVAAAPPRCPPPGARVRRGQPWPAALASLLFPQAATDIFVSRRSRVSSCSSFSSPFVIAVLSLSLSLSQQLPFTRTIRNSNGSVNYAIALVFHSFFKLRESTLRSFFCRHWWLHSKYALRIYVPEVLRFSSRPLLKLTWSLGEFLLLLLLAKLFVLLILLLFYFYFIFPLGWVEIGRKTQLGLLGVYVFFSGVFFAVVE